MGDYQDWRIADFSEGYIDSIDDNLLPESAARDCRNFIGREIGRLQSRKGQEYLNTTALSGNIQGLYAYYLEPDIKQFIAVANGKAYRWDPTGKNFVQIYSELSTVNPVRFETCANYMVGFDGATLPFKYNGTEATVLANAPAKGQFPVLYKEKLFVNPSDKPSQIWWSEAFYPEEWPATYYWSFSEGDGDKITNLMVYQDALLIFKHRSIHALRGVSIGDFRSETLEHNVGCAGPFAAKEFGGHVYFISQKGLYQFNGLKATNISEGKIPKLWSRANLKYIHKAAVTIWDNLIWFSLPIDKSTVNNLVIVCDPAKGTFWPMSGIEASCFQEFVANDDIPILYSGHTTSGHVIKQDTGHSDLGSAISAYWIGRSFDQNDANYQKKAKRAFVEDLPQTDQAVILELSLDYGDYLTMTPTANDGLIREYRFPTAIRGRWRYISPKFSYSGTSPCEVRGLLIPYKIKAKPRVKNASPPEEPQSEKPHFILPMFVS